jgi:DeoR family transcriptional regulator of aga operon
MQERPSAPRVALIPAQRHAMILQVLQTDGAASVQQLADAIGASVSTLRRDLEALEEAGFLDRTFGGASLRAHALTTLEPGHAVAAHIHQDEKAAIGAAAARGIGPHQAVIFDSSSTVREAARAVMARGIPLTAITNDLAIAQMLAGSSQIKVVVAGGLVRNGSMTLFGAPGEEFLAGVTADVALMGAHAVTEDGVSEATIEIARVKQVMLRAARTVRVLADHTKLRESAVFRICGLEAIDELVTDSRADPGICAKLSDRGITVTLAPSERG